MVQGDRSPGTADMTLMNSLMPMMLHQGEEATYGMTVKNTGPDAASGVLVTASLPGDFIYDGSSPSGMYNAMSGMVTFDLGTIPSGQSVPITIMGRPENPGQLVLHPLVRSDQTDPNGMNNTAMAETMVMPSPKVNEVTFSGFGSQPTHITVKFSSEINAQLASNTSNYTLVDLGHDNQLGMRDDRSIPIVAALPDPMNMAVHLIPRQHLSPHRQYRLIINGTPPQGLATGTGVPLLSNATLRLGDDDVEGLGFFNFTGANSQTLAPDRLVAILGGPPRGHRCRPVPRTSTPAGDGPDHPPVCPGPSPNCRECGPDERQTSRFRRPRSPPSALSEIPLVGDPTTSPRTTGFPVQPDG